MNKPLLIILISFFCSKLIAQSFSDPNFTVSTIVSGLTEPVGAVFSKDAEKLFVWEKAGFVYVCNKSGSNFVKQTTPVIDLTAEVLNWRDHGLMGFALDPDFATNGYIYLLYIVDRRFLMNDNSIVADAGHDATIARLTRYRIINSGGNFIVEAASRTILIGESPSTGIPVLHESHVIGSLAFAADGTLLVSTGDAASYYLMDAGSDSDTYWGKAINDGIIRSAENVGAFRSQILNSHNGKLLRIDPNTGNGISSNPFYSAAEARSAKSRVWAMGFRNPFRILIRPGSGSTNPAVGDIGEVYAGDVGWSTWEEFTIITGPGMNGGWPIYEGHEINSQYNTRAATLQNLDEPNPLAGQSGCSRPYFTFRELIKDPTADENKTIYNPCNGAVAIGTGPRYVHRRPAIDYKHEVTSSRVPIFSGNIAALAEIGTAASGVVGTPFAGNCALSGVWYMGDNFPPEYKNSFLLVDETARWIKRFTIDYTDVITRVDNLVMVFANITNLAENPVDGTLAAVDITNNSIKKIQYGGNQPPVSVPKANSTYGVSPLTVNFTGNTSYDLSPGGSIASYSWNFGGGTPATSTAANPTGVVFTNTAGVPKKFVVKLTVTDNGGATDVDSVIISVNNTPPQVNITSPVKNSTYPLGGDAVYNCTATVTDDEHSGSNLKYEWQTILRHNNHEHPEAVDNNVSTTTRISRIGCNGDTYYWLVKLKVTDAAGLVGIDSSKIFPDCGSDNIPPIVTSISPANGASGVAISTAVSANFNEAIDPSTVTSTTFQLKDAGNNIVTAPVSTSSNQITLTPSSSLFGSTVYTATIKGGSSGVKDLAGNALAGDYNWSFTTVAVDNIPPTVTLVSPLNGATGVNTSTTVTANFSEAINTSTITASTFQLKDAGNIVVTASLTTSSNQAVLTPGAALSGSTVYTATVKGGSSGVKDVAGNALVNDYTWSFTTAAADVTPPAVTSVSPVNGATEVSTGTTVIANFSEAINASTVNGSTVQLRDAANNLVSATLNTSGSQVTLTPSSALTGTTVYTATITGGSSGVKDLAGNALASNYSWSFTTTVVDNTAPTVNSVSPVNGATGISTSTSVTANFSEAINASTVTTSTFQLRNPSNTLITATVSTSGNQIILTPSAALAGSTVYTATITGGTSGVKDLAGNALASNYSWSFTTVVTTSSPVTIQSANTKTGTATTTHSLTSVPAGALLVLSTTADAVVSNCIVTSTPSLTWTKQVDAGATNSDNAEIWTAVYAAGGTITVNSNWGAGNSQASVCYIVTNAEPVLGGATATATLQAAPSVAITTTRDNSIIFGCTADWKAISGTTRTLRDGATEALYFKDGNYTTYHYYKAAATIGTYTEGISLPTGQSASTSLLEIRSNATSANVSPTITTQPAAQARCAGANASFTSAASGTPAPTVQWQQSTDGTTWTNITGATTGTLTFATTTADNNKQYRAVWTNSVSTVNSNPATLTVNPIPVLSSSLTVTATTGTAFTYTPTSATTGTTFTWTRAVVSGISNAAGSGTGTINETLVNTTASSVNVTYVYTLTANGCTNTQNVVVTVSTSVVSPTVTTQPAAQTRCAGASVSFTSAASGNPAPTVQWQESVNGTTWTNITGATASTLTFTTSIGDNNKQYRAAWTNSGSGVNSNPAILTVNPIPVLSSSLTGTATTGTAFTYTPTSATTGTTFTWTRAVVTGISNAAGNGTGTINETLVNTTALPVNVIYVYTLTANGCTNTQNVVVTVNTDGGLVSPTVTMQPSSQARCAGASVSFTSAASGNPVPTVRWQESVNGTTWTNITGATSSTLSFVTAIADNNKQYQAVWTNSEGTVTSDPATITVNPIPVLSSSLTSAATTGVAFTYTPTSVTTGTTFTWTRAVVSGISNAAGSGSGAINEILVNTTASPANVTYVYTLTANGCANTQNVVVTVSTDGGLLSPIVTTQPSSQTQCAGTNASFTSAASGNPVPTVQWQQSTNGGTTWTNITGATSGTLTFATSVADNNKQYRAAWTNSSATVNSNAAVLTVNPIPVLSSSLTGTASSGTAFAYTPTSATAGTTFTWTRATVTGISNTAGSGTGAINETLVNTTTAAVNVTYLYTLTANGCANTQNLIVTVNPASTVNCVINGSITSSFNSTSIPAGRYIWFNSSFNPGSLGSGTTPVTVSITNAVITFTANSVQYTLNVPNSRVRYDASVTSASTQFINNTWETVIPRSYSGYIFMGGLSYQVLTSLPGSISNINWTAKITIDRANTSLTWRWGAAVYTTFTTNHSGLNIKPKNGSTQNPYNNNNNAGTPENYKSFLVSGARGTGGTNYTGSFSSTSTATCTVTTAQRSAAQPLITQTDLNIRRLPAEIDIDESTRKSLEINVIPNPSNSLFNLRIKGFSKTPIRIRVTDIFGKEVERYEKINGNSSLQIGSRLKGGTYLVEVTQGDQRKILKIIKIN